MNINLDKLIQELEFAKKHFNTVVIPRGGVEPILEEIKELQQYKQAFEASRKSGVDLKKPLNKKLLEGMKHDVRDSKW